MLLPTKDVFVYLLNSNSGSFGWGYSDKVPTATGIEAEKSVEGIGVG